LDLAEPEKPQPPRIVATTAPRKGHDFVIEASAADIELDDDRVVSRLDHTRAVEVIEKLKVLSSSGHPCHHYVDDMFSPAPTLCAVARSVHIAAPSSAVALG
jgi:hypothetical protein